MSWEQSIQLIALALGLSGTWMVAFGLRIQEGIDPSFRKELHLDPKLIVPADVSQRLWLFKGGLQTASNFPHSIACSGSALSPSRLP